MPEQRYRTVLELALDDRSANAGVKRLSGQMDNLGKSIEEAFAGSALADLNKTLDRTAKLMEGIAKQQEKAARSGRTGGPTGAPQGSLAAMLTGLALGQGRGVLGVLDAHAGAGLHGTHGMGGRVAGAGWLAGRGLGRFANAAALGMGRMGGMMMNEGFIGQMLAGVPYLGPIFGGASAAAGGYYSSHVGRSRARAGAFGATGLSAADIGSFGNPYGLGPTELPGVLAQYAQAAGVRGREEIEQGFGRAATLSNILGVDYGATGGYERAVGRSALGGSPLGRDRAGEGLAVREALSSAIAAGVEQSQLGQVLENLSSSFEDMQTRGILVDPTSINSLIRGFGSMGAASGFGGMAGVRAATGMTNALRGVGQRENLFEMLALQEAGYGSGTSYMDARQRLEENPETVLPLLLRRLRGMGGEGDADSRAQMIQQGFSALGSNLSIRESRALASISEEQLARFTAPGGHTELAEYLAEQRATGEAMYETPRTEAAHEERRAGVGGDIAGDYQRIRSTEMEVVGQLLPPVVHMIRQVADLGRDLAEAFNEGGLRGVLQHVGGAILPSARETVDRATSTPESTGTALTTAATTAAGVAGGPMIGLLLQVLLDQIRQTDLGGQIGDMIVAGVRQQLRQALSLGDHE